MDKALSNTNRKKVLIIDDEVDLCLIMKIYYTRKNYHVQTAYNLRDALLSIYNQAPDIILLDVGTFTNPDEAVKMISEAAPGAEIRDSRFRYY